MTIYPCAPEFQSALVREWREIIARERLPFVLIVRRSGTSVGLRCTLPSRGPLARSQRDHAYHLLWRAIPRTDPRRFGRWIGVADCGYCHLLALSSAPLTTTTRS